MKEKVLQFGEGNFLRAFVDWIIDALNEKCGFDSSVTVIKPRPGVMPADVVANGGAFTVCLRGIKNGVTTEEKHRVKCTNRFLRSHEDYEQYIKCAHNPDLRIVVSNTTEAGIVYGDGDSIEDTPQKSFPAKITAFLYERYKYFSADKNKALIFLPCELIEKNGATLKNLVMRYADEWQLEAGFSSWLNHCIFCDTLVDRIVSGLQDGMVVAEPFYLWVIQAPNKEAEKVLKQELPFEKAGLNVVWTDDLFFYRKRKVRILNGAHTAMVPASLQYGLNIVAECIENKLVNSFLQKALFSEIIPSLTKTSPNSESVDAEVVDFANDTFERFANPFIKHQLTSIALNSVSKFDVRVLPSIIDYIDFTGSAPEALSFSFASLISFYREERKDDAAVLARFAEIFAHKTNAAEIVDAVFAEPWWSFDFDIAHNDKLKAKVSEYLAIILRDGIETAMMAAVK